MPVTRQINQRIQQEIWTREAAELSASFRRFVEVAWPIVEPGATFMPGMHIDAICEHLEACSRRQISKLLINVQPRAGKSTLVSVLYPAWVWTHTPAERLLYSSYALELARRDSTRTRRVILTDWYRQRWPHVTLAADQNTKGVFENLATGARQITSTKGPTTGLGGNQLFCDDPHNAAEADSPVEREKTIQWFREAFSTRVNPGKAPVSVVIMQRLHAADLTGYLLSEGGWDHLCLPTEYEAGGSRKATSIGWVDPRTEPGELLWKERYDSVAGRVELRDMKIRLGAVGTAGQLQQRPVPRGGSTFKKETLHFWYHEDGGEPEPVVFQKQDGTFIEAVQKPLPAMDLDSQLCSWDLAFKGGEKNDFVVGQVWGTGAKTDRANRYLLDQIRGNFDFVQTMAAVRRLKDRWPECNTILVEEKANGAAVIASLRNEIGGIIPINPQGGKVSRANAIAPLFEAGNIWIPHPSMPGFGWVQAWIDEFALFPRGHDDQVDATTQALHRLRTKATIDLDMTQTGGGPNPWQF